MGCVGVLLCREWECVNVHEGVRWWACSSGKGLQLLPSATAVYHSIKHSRIQTWTYTHPHAHSYIYTDALSHIIKCVTAVAVLRAIINKTKTYKTPHQYLKQKTCVEPLNLYQRECCLILSFSCMSHYALWHTVLLFFDFWSQ